MMNCSQCPGFGKVPLAPSSHLNGWGVVGLLGVVRAVVGSVDGVVVGSVGGVVVGSVGGTVVGSVDGTVVGSVVGAVVGFVGGVGVVSVGEVVVLSILAFISYWFEVNWIVYHRKLCQPTGKSESLGQRRGFQGKSIREHAHNEGKGLFELNMVTQKLENTCGYGV